MNIELNNDEALVLYEFIARSNNSGRFEILDQSEQRILWDIECLLEKELVEPFKPNYIELLESSRKRLRDNK